MIFPVKQDKNNINSHNLSYPLVFSPIVHVDEIYVSKKTKLNLKAALNIINNPKGNVN